VLQFYYEIWNKVIPQNSCIVLGVTLQYVPHVFYQNFKFMFISKQYSWNTSMASSWTCVLVKLKIESKKFTWWVFHKGTNKGGLHKMGIKKVIWLSRSTRSTPRLSITLSLKERRRSISCCIGKNNQLKINKVNCVHHMEKRISLIWRKKGNKHQRQVRNLSTFNLNKIEGQ